MLIVRILIIVLCLGAWGCEPDSTPTLLIGDIHSYISSTQLRDLVGAKPEQWIVIEENKTAPEDKRPPFNRLVLGLRDFVDLDVHGHANFYFFNDRLSSIRFYPDDYEKYKAQLSKTQHQNFDAASEITISRYAKIRIGKDAFGKAYVAFEDIKLESELTRWIAKYS